jgi:hypothetical protein
MNKQIYGGGQALTGFRQKINISHKPDVIADKFSALREKMVYLGAGLFCKKKDLPFISIVKPAKPIPFKLGNDKEMTLGGATGNYKSETEIFTRTSVVENLIAAAMIPDPTVDGISQLQTIYPTKVTLQSAKSNTAIGTVTYETAVDFTNNATNHRQANIGIHIEKLTKVELYSFPLAPVLAASNWVDSTTEVTKEVNLLGYHQIATNLVSGYNGIVRLIPASLLWGLIVQCNFFFGSHNHIGVIVDQYAFDDALLADAGIDENDPYALLVCSDLTKDV